MSNSPLLADAAKSFRPSQLTNSLCDFHFLRGWPLTVDLIVVVVNFCVRIDPRFIILLSTLTLTPRQYFSVLRLLPYVPIVYPFSFLSLSYISINFECVGRAS